MECVSKVIQEVSVLRLEPRSAQLSCSPAVHTIREVAEFGLRVI